MFRYAARNGRRCPIALLQDQHQRRRLCVAAIATGGDSDTTKRRALPVHHASDFLPRSGTCVPRSPSFAVHGHAGSLRVVGGQGGSSLLNTQPPLRQLSTRRGLPPGRSLPEKIFAGAVVAVLAAWGLVFGAITLLLLPFVGLGLFLLRRNFQRGGVSRNLAAGLARRMAERGAGVGGGGGGGAGGVPWMQRAPTEGPLYFLLATVLGAGLRGMELVSVLRSEVEKRALRHPGLSSSLGGGVEEFTDVKISTVGSVGGGGGRRHGQVPSRVIKARLRFSGKRGGAGGAGWAEVEVTEWEGGAGEEEEEEMEFDRIFVTLDNGRQFDLTSDSFSDDGNIEEGGDAQFLRRGQRSSSGGGGGGSKRASKAARGPKKGERTAGPVEAEFRDKCRVGTNSVQTHVGSAQAVSDARRASPLTEHDSCYLVVRGVWGGVLNLCVYFSVCPRASLVPASLAAGLFFPSSRCRGPCCLGDFRVFSRCVRWRSCFATEIWLMCLPGALGCCTRPPRVARGTPLSPTIQDALELDLPAKSSCDRSRSVTFVVCSLRGLAGS